MVAPVLEIRESIRDIARDEWMALVRAAGAPVFYDYSFLSAYERAPLQRTYAFFYLIMWPWLDDAMTLRRRVVEVGRANSVTKQRFRLAPYPLFAFVGRP